MSLEEFQLGYGTDENGVHYYAYTSAIRCSVTPEITNVVFEPPEAIKELERKRHFERLRQIDAEITKGNDWKKKLGPLGKLVARRAYSRAVGDAMGLMSATSYGPFWYTSDIHKLAEERFANAYNARKALERGKNSSEHHSTRAAQINLV